MASTSDNIGKIKRWNGKEETWLSWKREFTTKIALKKLGKFLDITNKPVVPNANVNNGQDLANFKEQNNTLYLYLQLAINNETALYL